jgi:hypothetical protein
MTLLVNKLSTRRDYSVTDKTWELMIEYTTACNLKCSYCAVSSPSWRSLNLDETLADQITKQVIDRQPAVVTIHGHGETTILPGWEQKAEQFIRAGLKVSICTNLCKLYTERELQALASLDHLTVSIDTLDVQLFKKLRKGGDIRHLVYNLTRIINISKKHGYNLTTSWSIVCCDQSIWGLIDLIEYGISLGVDGFTLCNLGVTEVADGAIETNHISELDIQDCHDALTILNRVKHLCDMNNRHIDIKAGIYDTLKIRIHGGK